MEVINEKKSLRACRGHTGDSFVNAGRVHEANTDHNSNNKTYHNAYDSTNDTSHHLASPNRSAGRHFNIA